MEKVISPETDDFKKATARGWNLHEANVTLYSALTEMVPLISTKPDRTPDTIHSSIPRSNQPLLPPEIALQILKDSSRWILTSSDSVRIIDHKQISAFRSRRSHYVPGYDFPIQIVRTRPLSTKEVKQIRKVAFEFKGERIFTPNYLTSTTAWSSMYKITVESADDSFTDMVCQFDVCWDERAREDTVTYRVEFAGPHEMMTNLEKGDRIQVTIDAPNWFCVSEAGFEIWSEDDLSMGGDMKWVKEKLSSSNRILTSRYWRRQEVPVSRVSQAEPTTDEQLKACQDFEQMSLGDARPI